MSPGSESGRHVRGGSVEVGGVKIFVGAAEIKANGQLVGKVEFNPSRIVDPEGYGLAGVADAMDAAQLAFSAASELLDWKCPPGDARVRRLDVARDFSDVRNPASLIRSLAPLHRPWSRKNLVHADPSRNGAQTLMVGVKGGVARLYDKFAETKGAAAPGTVRWEAECRSGWIERYGDVVVMADVSDERVLRLARDRWEWSAMGAEVAGLARVVERVRESELTEREQAGFLGWLLMQSQGGAWLPSTKTLTKYRKVQRDLGVAVEDVAQAAAESITSRLDFDTGREVLKVA